MRKYECILFDLDGTLMNTSKGILDCISYVVEKFDLPTLSEKEKHKFIGPPIQQSFQTYYKCTSEEAWELATAWRTAYQEQFMLQATPYEGIYSLLDALQKMHYKLGIATNKRQDYTIDLLNYFHFLPYFNCIVGADFEGKRNKADIIKICMHQLGIAETHKCLMIGDTMGDLIAAQTVGVDFLGVTYGFGFSKVSNDLDCQLVNCCRDIQDMIE